jgi:hypothetical protein
MLTDLTAQAKQEGVLAGYNSVRVPQLAMTTKAKSQTVAYDPSDELVFRPTVTIMVTVPSLSSGVSLAKCHST